MTHKLIIEGELPDLNTYTRVARSNKYASAKMKKDATHLVAYNADHLPTIDYRVDVAVTWYCPNRRKDKDNIQFAIKFILDGLVEAGVLENDGWDQIGDIRHRCAVDTKKPRVVVLLTPSRSFA